MPRQPRAPKRPVTVAHGAQKYGLSDRTVYRYIASGLLPAYRVGPRMLRIDLDDLERLARPVQAARPAS
jgi:excisionase family DNA binding protein